MRDPASLERPLGIPVRPLSAANPLSQTQKKPSPLWKKFKPSTMLTFAKEDRSLEISQKESQISNISLEKEEIKAKKYLSTIEDPLWKHVCCDVINMMGPASVLKIWNSTLGEVSSQAKDIEIYSPTEETSQFIQQYDFVILGSLQPYFPALKQIRVKTTRL